MKRYLPNGEIKITKSGKPYLENGPFFNLSHGDEYIAFISSAREVGIDIERINQNKLDGIRYVLNQEEKEVADINTLFQIWSNKESLVKCTSNGLKDIKSVKGLPLIGNRNIEGQDYYTESMIYDCYSLSVTLKGKEPFKIRIERINSLEER